MTSERWQQVEAVLQAALDRPPHERVSFLNGACSGDEGLRQEASSLIDAYDEAGDFIEEPAIAHDAHVLIGNHQQNNLGREIGPYQVVERLGAGGMGEVYLAQDRRLDREVALKILPAYFVSDEARLCRFQREARAASALNHPNILTIHEVGEVDQVHFITTEFIDGQTLRELIAQENLSLVEVLEIAIQVAEALTAAHAAGIVHRDIKPENIMRRRGGLVKLLDFGIAKLLEQPSSDLSETATIAKTQTETGVVLGTVGYMSPEQARALPVDERTDIWSLGVVLYEMLAYRAPFEGATRMDTMVAILEREPAPLFQFANAPAVLSELKRVVSKALRKERDERYQTAGEMLTDLKRVRQKLEPNGAHVLDDSMRGARMLQGVDEDSFGPSRYETTKARSYHYGLQVLSVAVLIVVVIVTALLYRRSKIRANAVATIASGKLYQQMNAAEQLAFVDEQEQRISAMMGDRPMKLNDEAIKAIKSNLDRYFARTDSTSANPGAESLRVIYGRAAPIIPLIAPSFSERKIPLVVGIYLPMIESEYKPCYENSAGAKGLFQFMPQTAEQYGVARGDMCDVEKMAPAAAHYLADRMAELGDDSQSMTLVLLSYNRGAEPVRETLRLLRETDSHYERNFWTLFANRDKLDDTFRNESAYYIPSFFAVAIIGENPQTFGLQTPPLSTIVSNSAPTKPSKN
jgi:serine/threonine protein kinase